MASDNEIVVRLTAKIDELNSQLQSASAAVAEANKKMASSSATVSQAWKDVAKSNALATASAKDHITASGLVIRANNEVTLSNRALAEAQGRQVQATSEQIEASQALNSAQNEAMGIRGGQADFTTIATEATEANTAATLENAAAQSTLNTRMMSGNATREYGALVDEALRGRYRQMIGTSAVLANRMNLLRYAFSPLGAAILAGVGALGGLVAITISAENRMSKLRNALLATGSSSGLTADQLSDMASRIGMNMGTIGEATDALKELAMSGRFVGDSLNTAGQAAVDLAQLTGEKVTQTAKTIESLGEDPAKAVAKLNEQFHFLTLSQYEQITALEATGNHEAAAKLALDDFSNELHTRAVQSESDMNIFAKGWRHLKNAIDEAGDALNRDFGGGGDAGKLKDLKSELAAMRNAGVPEGGATERRLKAQIAILEARIKSTQEVVQEKAHQDALNQAAIQGRETLDATYKSLKNISVAMQEVAKNKAALEAIHAANPNDSALKGMSFHGNVLVGGPGWEKLKAELQHKFDSHDFTAHVKVDRQPALKPINPRAVHTFAPPTLSTVKPMQSSAQIISGIQAEVAANQRLNQVLKQNQLAYQQMSATIGGYFSSISNAFDQTVKGVIRGTETWKMGMHKMGQSILQEQISNNIHILTDFLAKKTTELLFSRQVDNAKVQSSQAAGVQTNAAQAAATVAGMSMQGTAAMSSIGTSAATAAAGSASSVSSIPVVGWAMAAEVAAATLALVLGYKSMVSAAGGWDRVPYDGAHAILHQDEMVLPAQIASPLRTMANRAGLSGKLMGDTHLHISAMDSRSFGRFLKSNKGALAEAARSAQRAHMFR